MSRFGVASPGAPREPAPVASLPAPPRRRRAIWLVPVVGALVAGAVVGGYQWGRGSTPSPPATLTYMATRTALPAGHQLVASDLRPVTLQGRSTGLSPATPFLTPAGESSALGTWLRTALPAGVIVSAGDLTTSPLPGGSQTLVGLDLKPNETPTGSALVAGDRVGLLYVPAATQPPYPSPQPLVAASVWGVSPGESGSIDVTVVVASTLAPTLAADAQHDEIAAVRLSRHEAWPPTAATKAPTTATTKAPTAATTKAPATKAPATKPAATKAPTRSGATG